MRFLAILLLVTLAFFSAEALKKRQLQKDEQHQGYCPMHRIICAIYCPPFPINLGSEKPINGCTSDSHCATDEKCCKPACGCTNKCVKALDKPGFDQSG